MMMVDELILFLITVIIAFGLAIIGLIVTFVLYLAGKIDKLSNEVLEIKKREINYSDCKELSKILRRDVGSKRANGDILTVIFTAGVLIYVGIVLSELSKKRSSPTLL